MSLAQIASLVSASRQLARPRPLGLALEQPPDAALPEQLKPSGHGARARADLTGDPGQGTLGLHSQKHGLEALRR